MSARQVSHAVDDRIPVRFGRAEDAQVGAALLIEGDAPVPPAKAVGRFALTASPHRMGCACCIARGPVAEALSRLFLNRARGDVPFFDQVVVAARDANGVQAVRDALVSDVMLRARFRLME